jgi:hypothetical protein
VASFERDNGVVFYFFSTSESWPDKRGDLLWEWPYKRGDIVPTLLNQCLLPLSKVLPITMVIEPLLTMVDHVRPWFDKNLK